MWRRPNAGCAPYATCAQREISVKPAPAKPTVAFAMAVALLALLALLTGCAPARLIRPVGPSALERSIEVRQQITAHFDGKTRTLQVALRVTPKKLSMVGLTAIGQRLFTLSWNGQVAHVKSLITNLQKLPPKRVLADLELAYWPLPSLRGALVRKHMRLEQLGTTRTLWRGNQLLWLSWRAAGKPWQSRLDIYNVRAGYRLDIRPLAMDGAGS